MKFLIDMKLSPRWADVLSAAGFDAVTLVGNRKCRRSGFGRLDVGGGSSVVVTADLDFPAILASTQGQGPSVLLIRSDNLSPENLKSAVLQTIRIAREELEAGAIISIDPSRSRIRLLPLRR